MLDPGFDHHPSACWIISESSGRWATAVRRFAPELLPPRGIPCIAAPSTPEVLSLLAIDAPRIILWEFRRESLVKGCESLTQTAKIAPDSLQLVACHGISERQQITLSELPVAGFVRHPEDLPRLKPMIQGYFARYRQLLD